MKPVKIAIIGNGDRANCYCKYALTNPQDLTVTAIVDPDKRKQEEGAKLYSVPTQNCFDSVGDLLRYEESRGKLADCVVNATMDELHYSTAMPLLRAGYSMLLEKPVVNNTKQLLEIKKAAEDNRCLLMICHVLRYTPFYRRIKELLLAGEIGEIMHMETCENVGIAHSSNSYIRGKWNSQKRIGSSMLLAKCCHDLDMLCWLNNATVPTRVASFGGRNFLIESKAPKGAGTKCLVDCPHVEDCQYSAKAIYVDNNNYPWYSWQCLNKDYNQITMEERIESLKTFNPHGDCAYKTDSDIVDHQALILRFRNGSTATHSMVQGAARPCRIIRIMGTAGEIEGMIEESTFFVRKFDKTNAHYYEKRYNVQEEIESGDHHAGGDAGIIRDFVKMIRGEQPSVSCTKIDDSIYGHLCVFKADESMLENREKSIKITTGAKKKQ